MNFPYLLNNAIFNDTYSIFLRTCKSIIKILDNYLYISKNPKVMTINKISYIINSLNKLKAQHLNDNLNYIK